MARFRRGSLFATDAQIRGPLDRNQRARVLLLAESLERSTKGAGRASGCLGLTGLAVLRTLLLRFLGPSGVCVPSYDRLQRETGFCRQTIARALAALEAAGIVIRIRRLIRERVDGVLVTRQTSNAYLFHVSPVPRPAAVRTTSRRFAWARHGAESTASTETTKKLETEPLPSWRSAGDWRERARKALGEAIATARR